MLFAASCSDFLDTVPADALSPQTTWKTEDDANKFAVGCYDGWEDGNSLLYYDCMSDFGYNNFPWEGYNLIGNGTMSPSSPGVNFYDYTIIGRCNTFLKKIGEVPFADEADKKDLIAQIRFLRAYRYFVMNWAYGGVPIIDNYQSAEEAKVPRKSEADVREFIASELKAAIADLRVEPKARGRVAKGAALALSMREALYYGEWQKAKEAAEAIIALGKYSLESDYAKLFRVDGQDSQETILAVQYIPETYVIWVLGAMYNNGDGGWSSIVPTYQLIDTYEMKSGKVITDPDSGYDPVHPFKDRDPRLAMTVCYPGADYLNGKNQPAVFNTLDKILPDGSTNGNYMHAANNASKTGLTWNKYLAPRTQYPDVWKTNTCPIVFRYAEVLLSWAEAVNELTGPSGEVYDRIDQIRRRAGMPEVDRARYSTRESLRELIRRERAVEFAGEGIRRADLLRWKTDNGEMLASKVLNCRLERRVGTVDMNGKDPETRASINTKASSEEVLVEARVFHPHFRYLPFDQENCDKNPNLEQNPNY